MATDLKSRIILSKNIKVDRNYNNVLSYSEDEMLSLCQTNKVIEADNYSFIRTNQTILCDFDYEICLQANYIAFQNPDYSNKWFFAWIDEVNYKGDNNTEIVYTIDSWSTWFDYWQAQTCFVVREHVNDDTIGANTVDEGLNVGEVIQERVTEDLSYSNQFGYWIAVASNWEIKDDSTGEEILDTDKGTQYAGITVYNNVVFGTQIFLIKINQLSDFVNLYLLLSRTNLDGHIEDVQSIFILPNVAINEGNLTYHTAKLITNEFGFYTMSYSTDIRSFNTEIEKISSFSDYTPINNKCFVYPYNYIFVSNNNGSNNIYKYELFNSDSCIFENQFAISIGGSGRIVPKNYKNMDTNDDEALALGKYPTCAWSSDAFTNWLTTQGVNIAVNTALLAAGIASTVATGGVTLPVVAGATMSVASNIGSNIGSFHQANLMPNISGGQATGDIIWGSDRNKFTIRQMRVKTEYIKIIDNYFTRFGYKINRVKVPNITGRQNFNFVEIGSEDVIGYGTVPSNYMDNINNACRKGVTIWHNHINLGNFNVSNNIV